MYSGVETYLDLRLKTILQQTLTNLKLQSKEAM